MAIGRPPIPLDGCDAFASLQRSATSARSIEREENAVAASSDNYREQAERCEAEAATADLTLVRERNLRSAAAWHALANRQFKSEQARAVKEQLADAVRAKCLG
jgi:hypothetical protein